MRRCPVVLTIQLNRSAKMCICQTAAHIFIYMQEKKFVVSENQNLLEALFRGWNTKLTPAQNCAWDQLLCS